MQNDDHRVRLQNREIQTLLQALHSYRPEQIEEVKYRNVLTRRFRRILAGTHAKRNY